MSEIKVEGLKELRKSLRDVEDGVKDLKAIGKGVAQIVADAAKIEAPVLTGRLSNSIKAGATARAAYVKTGNIIYSGPIHFGWRKRNISPQPFLVDARDSRLDEIFSRYDKGIHDLVEKAFAGQSA